MTALDISTLEASMEALIQQQVAAYEARLRESLARTLAKAVGGSPGHRSSRPATAAKGGASLTRRRTAEELEALAERFFAAVEGAPGQTMVTYAASLGLRAQDLEPAVSRLKKAGRVKTVGERNRMRYYPMRSSA